MADNRHRILLRRGTSEKIASETELVAYGQPLFDIDKNYLFIGSNKGAVNAETNPYGLKTPKDLFPIKVRTLQGWFADDTNNYDTKGSGNATLQANLKALGYKIYGKYSSTDNNNSLIIDSDKRFELKAFNTKLLEGVSDIQLEVPSSIFLKAPSFVSTSLRSTSNTSDVNITLTSSDTTINKDLKIAANKTFTSPFQSYLQTNTQITGNLDLDAITTFSNNISNDSANLILNASTGNLNVVKITATGDITAAANKINALDIEATNELKTKILNVTDSCSSDFKVTSGKSLFTNTIKCASSDTIAISESGKKVTLNGTITISGTLII